MVQLTNEFKYQKHSEKQYVMILSAAERLFIEKGIEKVNLSDIANECGIMRSTFYRYFKNKEEVLWHIMRRDTLNFSQKLLTRFEATTGTTFDRFQVFLDILVEGFVDNTDFYLFISQFNRTYQNATSSRENSLYEAVYQADEFRSGDTVRFLTEHFHDGSVKGELDPKTTAVTIMYSAFSIVSGMSKQQDTLPAKYGVTAEQVVRISLNTLLESIKA